ncbi:hypothetical protein MO973_19030 [Paenibacillus sp. TRM 82003]|nr:hypothetical protein [Paenibacillus sp. TRM 82003]
MSVAERWLKAKQLEEGMERSGGPALPANAEEQAPRTIQRERKNASVLPRWLSLQHEVHDRLVQLKKLTALGVTGGLDDSLEELNRKIVRYNELVPAPVLQKAKLTRDNFISQLTKWE